MQSGLVHVLVDGSEKWTGNGAMQWVDTLAIRKTERKYRNAKEKAKRVDLGHKERRRGLRERMS